MDWPELPVEVLKAVSLPPGWRFVRAERLRYHHSPPTLKAYLDTPFVPLTFTAATLTGFNEVVWEWAHTVIQMAMTFGIEMKELDHEYIVDNGKLYARVILDQVETDDDDY